MQKTFEYQPANRTIDPKKEKQNERNHTYYYLKKSAIKKMLELAKNFDQDIYICLHDKK